MVVQRSWQNNCCPATVNQVGDTFTAGSLQTVVLYVEKRWISSRIYPIASWCVFRQAIRTNNDVEGYHNDLNTQAVIGNPPFYLLCRLLHRESLLLPLQVKLVCEGKLKRYQRKQSSYIQGRIFSLWDQYAQHQISASILVRRCAFVYGPTAATGSPQLTSNPCLYQGFSYEKSGFMPV